LQEHETNSSPDESTQMLHSKISRLDLHSAVFTNPSLVWRPLAAERHQIST